MKFALLSCLIAYYLGFNKNEIPDHNKLKVKDILGATEIFYNYH